jgi:hypothetical protein
VGQFKNVSDLARRAQLDPHNLQVLAATNALSTLASNRREALWQSVTTVPDKDMLSVAKVEDDAPELGAPSEAEDTDHEGALLVGERIRRAVEGLQIRHLACGAGIVTVSCGVASGHIPSALYAPSNCATHVWLRPARLAV